MFARKSGDELSSAKRTNQKDDPNYQRPAAKQDLIEQADFIAQDNLDAALRFLDSAEKTFAQLARLPRIGKSRKAKGRVFTNVRQFPISGFEKYLVFYRPLKGGIEVLRVLHGARDLNLIIGEELS